MILAQRGQDGSGVHVEISGVSYWCKRCDLFPGRNLFCSEASEMVAHLQVHRERGAVVPEAAITHLQAIPDHGPTMMTEPRRYKRGKPGSGRPRNGGHG